MSIKIRSIIDELPAILRMGSMANFTRWLHGNCHISKADKSVLSFATMGIAS